jgi:hypothetical protein
VLTAEAVIERLAAEFAAIDVPRGWRTRLSSLHR